MKNTRVIIIFKSYHGGLIVAVQNIAAVFGDDMALETIQIHEAQHTEWTLIDKATVLDEIMLTGIVAT